MPEHESLGRWFWARALQILPLILRVLILFGSTQARATPAQWPCGWVVWPEIGFCQWLSSHSPLFTVPVEVPLPLGGCPWGDHTAQGRASGDKAAALGDPWSHGPRLTSVYLEPGVEEAGKGTRPSRALG